MIFNDGLGKPQLPTRKELGLEVLAPHWSVFFPFHGDTCFQEFKICC